MAYEAIYHDEPVDEDEAWAAAMAWFAVGDGVQTEVGRG